MEIEIARAQRQQKKQKKVRSAWISFVGRIVAQFIGAAATIVLGLLVVDRYKTIDARHHDAAAVVEAAAAVRERSGAPALAVLPVQDYSSAQGQSAIADAITEALVAEMAQSAQVRILSRTSAMAYRTTAKSLPVIARELAADWIVESSIVRDGARVRLTMQLIDAKTDEHVLARVYEQSGDLFAAQTRLAARAAKDVNAALVNPVVRASR
jgi:TolB-like protein